MDHPEGTGSQRADRVTFDPRVRLEFRGTQLSSDGGLLVMRELDDALGLSDLASAALCDSRRGKNTLHRLDRLFRQAAYGRLAGYEDVNDADRLALDPVKLRLGKSEWIVLGIVLVYSFIPVFGGLIRVFELAGGPQIAPQNSRALLAPLPIALHILSSILFCVLGAFQFLPSLCDACVRRRIASSAG
jgi:hypothetical protein